MLLFFMHANTQTRMPACTQARKHAYLHVSLPAFSRFLHANPHTRIPASTLTGKHAYLHHWHVCTQTRMGALTNRPTV